MKTEPKAFTELPTPIPGRPCPACCGFSLSYQSDYPSNVPPFAEQTVLYCTHCGLGHVPDSAQMLADYYRADSAKTTRRIATSIPKPIFPRRIAKPPR